MEGISTGLSRRALLGGGVLLYWRAVTAAVLTVMGGAGLVLGISPLPRALGRSREEMDVVATDATTLQEKKTLHAS